MKAKNSVEKFRARTVLFHLQRLRNLSGELATEPDTVLDWLPFEAWYATRALRPGFYRVDTAVAALDDTPTVDPERMAWAARLFEEERAKLDFDLCERLAVGLYRRAPSPENVERLARVYGARGNGTAALRVLDEALAASDDPLVQHKLYTARARAAGGMLDERSSLADYGAALALGSREAALDLGAAALSAGEREKVRFLSLQVLRASPLDPEARILRAQAQLPARASELPR